MKKINATSLHNCRFCLDSSGVKSDRLIDTPWYEDEFYAAFVSQGAFIPGWTVIVPKKHDYNMSNHYGTPEFESFYKAVNERLEKVFSKTIVFEHGPLKEGSKLGCGTDHAHVHVVPINLDFCKEVKSYSPSLKWIEVDFNSPFNAEKEYLMYSENFNFGDKRSVFYCELELPISQFFRKVLARHLDILDKYNYKDFPYFKEANQSLLLLENSK